MHNILGRNENEIMKRGKNNNLLLKINKIINERDVLNFDTADSNLTVQCRLLIIIENPNNAMKIGYLGN